jgi:hypothetical protein
LRRRRSGMSNVLSTIILASTLLIIVQVASIYASNSVNIQVENAHFDQSKNVLLSLTHVIGQTMLSPDSSGYVRTSFSKTYPQFVNTGQNLSLTFIDGSLNWTYRFPINIIKIRGGQNVGVSVPRILYGEDTTILKNASGPLGRVKVYQDNGAWLSLDYSQVRCAYVGTTDFFNGTGYQSYNEVEISVVNMTFGSFNPADQTLVTAQNMGIATEPFIQVSSNCIVRVQLSGGTPVNLALINLGGNPARPILITIVPIDICVSMTSGG